MQLTCLPLSLFLWLAACSSPGVQTASFNAIPTKDTVAKPATDSLADLVIVRNFTAPPYGRDTIESLLAKLRKNDPDQSGFYISRVLDEKIYASLPLNHKFTYHMMHREQFRQNCSLIPMHTEQANRIYVSLGNENDMARWSERQVNFFKNNRDSVISLMKPLIEKNNLIGENFKEAIIEMNATGMIPYLINFYNREKKDRYILTVLIQLMKQNKYPEFLNSIEYQKLFNPKEIVDYNSAPHLFYNKANEERIIKQAKNFHHGLQAK